MSMPEDLAAIDRYMKNTPVLTAAARAVKDEWVVWYDGIGWWGSYSQANYDHARNVRNRFNLANAVTAEDRAWVDYVMRTGLTTEEMAGGTRRTLSTGMYDEPPKPILSDTTRVALIAGGVATAVGVILITIGKLETLGPRLALKMLGK